MVSITGDGDREDNRETESDKCEAGTQEIVAKAKKGELSKAKVDECFNGWKGHTAKGTSYQL